MKFFIDTANTKQIKEAWDIGVIDGVTTNPSLIAKENKKPQSSACDRRSKNWRACCHNTFFSHRTAFKTSANR